MKLSYNEITLKRISQEDIEMLRIWRNQKNVSDFMFFQEEITPKKQQEWFDSLNDETDFYFKIIYRNLPIGLINLKQIDWNKKNGESGLFIAVEKYRKTHLPYFASIAFLKYFFEERNLEQILAKVKDENKNIIKYNQSLGFVFVDNQTYVINKKRFQGFLDKMNLI